MPTSMIAPRRWDGRAWMVRITVAGLSAAVAPFLIDDASTALRLALLTAALWLPAISISERVRLQWPGPVPVAASALVDLAAVAIIARWLPPLAPVLAIAVLPSALVHALDLSRWWRRGLGVTVALVQLVVLVPDLTAALGAVILASDVASGLGAVLLLGYVERDRRLSRAALDHAGELTDAVLAGIGEAVVVTDRHGVITSANVASAATFGGEVRGPCASALALARGAAELDCSNGCPLLGPDGSASQVDVERTHPTGRRQSLLVNVRALRDPLGRIREVVHSYRDVTSLKEADQAKTLFLATASHELKTPLAVIGGFAELLAGDRMDDPQMRRQALDTIVTRSKQLTSIVERLLLASRIDAGGLRIVTETVDVVGIGRERVAAIGAVSERDITWRTSRPIPPVQAEPVALATVIDHLIENAVKYSPDGGLIEVEVDVDETHVTVDVADHGIGMSPTDAEHCFQPFWQAERTDTRRFGGSGIGLYIVASLVQAMGGEVSVPRAIPGTGTTIRLTLRRADRPAADRDEATTTVDDRGVGSVEDLARQVGMRPDG